MVDNSGVDCDGFLARHLNMAPNKPTHTHARLVITEQWLVLASDKGVLLREDRNGRLKLKDLERGGGCFWENSQ